LNKYTAVSSRQLRICLPLEYTAVSVLSTLLTTDNYSIIFKVSGDISSTETVRWQPL